jgi:hypothetical protein
MFVRRGAGNASCLVGRGLACLFFILKALDGGMMVGVAQAADRDVMSLDLEQQTVKYMWQKVDSLRRKDIEVSSPPPIAAPFDETMLGRKVAAHKGDGPHAIGGGFNMQATLHPFLARPRPADAIARAVASTFTSPGGSRASDAGNKDDLCCGAGALRLQEANNGMEDSSGFLGSDVEQGIIDDIAAQARQKKASGSWASCTNALSCADHRSLTTSVSARPCSVLSNARLRSLTRLTLWRSLTTARHSFLSRASVTSVPTFQWKKEGARA